MSLLSNIHYTLYALLPTLGSQLADRYPIEQTSQALQGMSMASSAASIEPEQVTTGEPDNSLHLSRGDSDAGTSVSGNESHDGTGVGESWASEFQRRDGVAQAGDRDEVRVEGPRLKAKSSSLQRLHNRYHSPRIFHPTPTPHPRTYLVQSCSVHLHLVILPQPLQLLQRVKRSYGRISKFRVEYFIFSIKAQADSQVLPEASRPPTSFPYYSS